MRAFVIVAHDPHAPQQVVDTLAGMLARHADNCGMSYRSGGGRWLRVSRRSDRSVQHDTHSALRQAAPEKRGAILPADRDHAVSHTREHSASLKLIVNSGDQRNAQPLGDGPCDKRRRDHVGVNDVRFPALAETPKAEDRSGSVAFPKMVDRGDFDAGLPKCLIEIAETPADNDLVADGSLAAGEVDRGVDVATQASRVFDDVQEAQILFLYECSVTGLSFRDRMR
jgi:hypothetical protein